MVHKHYFRFFVLSWICWTFISCKNEPPQPKGGINGKVIIIGTQVGVEGANISISGPKTGSISTGIDGNYSFLELPTGTYSLTINVPLSYRSAAPKTVIVNANQVTKQDVPLIPKGEIVGTILEAGTINPILGALVELNGGRTKVSLSTGTGNNGKYSFEELSDGSYELFASHPDYASVKREINITNGESIPADISMSKDLPTPIPDFSVENNGCKAPCSISFINKSSNAVSSFWEFGDGNVDSMSSPTHTYDNPGDYPVTLTVENEKGIRRSITKSAHTNWETFIKLVQSSIAINSGYFGTSISQLDNGGYIVTGSTSNSSSKNVYVARISKDGVLRETPSEGWERSYGNPFEDDEGFSLVPLSNNNFMIVGYSGNPLESKSDLYILHIDEFGNRNDNRTKTVDINLGTDIGRSALLNDAGNYVFVGFTSNSFDNFDAFAMEIDSLGGLIWSQSYGGEEDDFIHDLISTSMGNYILVGTTNSQEKGNTKEDVYLIEINTNGETVQQKILGSESNDVGKKIIQTQDGGYAIIGHTNRRGTNDFYLIKLGPGLSTEWEKIYPRPENCIAESLIQTPGGKFVLVGYKTSNNGTGDDELIIVTDSNGENEFYKTFSNSSGNEKILDIIPTSDGGYIMIGSSSNGNAGSRLYLIKTDNNLSL